MRLRLLTLAIALTAPLTVVFPGMAQTHYASGQNVVPVYEGWEHNPDGSFSMVFGYMNRNYEQQLEVPVGPDNKFEPEGPDRNQPTHFYPRRQQFVFKVRVPADWGTKDMVWTLTSAGHTEKAFGTLKSVWELGNLVYQENRGGPADMSYPEEPNQPPTIEMTGDTHKKVKVGEALPLTVLVADDGHPSARARGVTARDPEGAPAGPKRESPLTQAVVRLDPGVALGVTWVVYRAGPGTVSFDPLRIKVTDSKATTRVTFDKPGIYSLRAYADDSVLLAPLDVTVTVE